MKTPPSSSPQTRPQVRSLAFFVPLLFGIILAGRAQLEAIGFVLLYPLGLGYWLPERIRLLDDYLSLIMYSSVYLIFGLLFGMIQARRWIVLLFGAYLIVVLLNARGCQLMMDNYEAAFN